MTYQTAYDFTIIIWNIFSGRQKILCLHLLIAIVVMEQIVLCDTSSKYLWLVICNFHSLNIPDFHYYLLLNYYKRA